MNNWYDREEEGYSPLLFRAQMVPLDWKSTYGTGDKGSDFKTGFDPVCRRGDMVVRDDGIEFLISWPVDLKVNCQSTQIKKCNLRLEVYRRIPDVVDSLGYLVLPAHNDVIAPEIPAAASLYYGRPEYQVSVNVPGILADNIAMVQAQWNPSTMNIKINDEFIWGNYTYRVVDVNFSEVDIDMQYGLVNLTGRKVAGSELNA